MFCLFFRPLAKIASQILRKLQFGKIEFQRRMRGGLKRTPEFKLLHTFGHNSLNNLFPNFISWFKMLFILFSSPSLYTTYVSP